MDCNDVRIAAEAYSLGALDDAQRESIEQHLATCRSCHEFVRTYQAIVANFPPALATVSSLRLPAALKSQVIAALDRSPSLPAPAVEVEADPEPAALSNATTAARLERSSAPPRRIPATAARARWGRPRTLGLAAAVILVILGLGWNIRLSVALAHEQVLRSEFANLVSQQQVVIEVVDSPSTVKARLAPPGGGSPAYGKMYTRPDRPEIVVMAARLPPPPDGQSYFLWVTDDAGTRLAGVLSVNSQGFGLVVDKASRLGITYNAAQITLQPEGSTTLSGTPILQWQAGP